MNDATEKDPLDHNFDGKKGGSLPGGNRKKRAPKTEVPDAVSSVEDEAKAEEAPKVEVKIVEAPKAAVPAADKKVSGPSARLIAEQAAGRKALAKRHR